MADLVCIIIIIVPHRGLEAKKPASRLIVDSVCLLLSTSNKSSFWSNERRKIFIRFHSQVCTVSSCLPCQKEWDLNSPQVAPAAHLPSAEVAPVISQS